MSSGPPPVCAGCNQAVDGRYLMAINRPYHPQCFKCVDCSKSLLNQPHALNASQNPICQDCAVAAMQRANPNAKIKVEATNAPAPASGAPAPAAGGSFCPSCGAKAAGSKFCSGCGNKLN